MIDISQRTAESLGFNLENFLGPWIKEKEIIYQGYKDSFEDFDFETNCFLYKLFSSSNHPYSKGSWIEFSKSLDATIPSTINFNLGIYFPELRINFVNLISNLNIQDEKRDSLHIDSPSSKILETISHFSFDYKLTPLGEDIIKEMLRRDNYGRFLLESIPKSEEMEDFRKNLEFFEENFLKQTYFSYLTPNYSGA